MKYCKFCGMVLFETDNSVDICPVCELKTEMNQTFSAQNKRIDDAMKAPFECPKLPKLSKGAYKNISFPLSTFAHGVKKQDFETESQIESELIASIHKDMSKFYTANVMAVESCLYEILCTLPVLWNCQERMSHIIKKDDSGYHAVSLDGVVLAEFTITPLHSENSIAFERSIKYSADAEKVRHMAALGDYLDILKQEEWEED